MSCCGLAPPAFTGGRGLKRECNPHPKAPHGAPPAFTGGRGLKPWHAPMAARGFPGTARLHRRARIETSACMTTRPAPSCTARLHRRARIETMVTLPPTTSAPGTARLHRRARIETCRLPAAAWRTRAPPAFTGGRGLKPRNRSCWPWPGQAPPAFTGGRGLKLAGVEVPAQLGRTARLHRRARIETTSRLTLTMPAHAPPAFTGGRGLKLYPPTPSSLRRSHRPPSPAGAD